MQWRMAMHLAFCVGWLTPEESSPLDYTTAELEAAGVSDHVMQVRSVECIERCSPTTVPKYLTIVI